jgi:hypothetical protein
MKKKLNVYLVGKESRVVFCELLRKTFEAKGHAASIFYVDLFDEIVNHPDFLKVNDDFKITFESFYGTEKAKQLLTLFETRSKGASITFINITSDELHVIDDFIKVTPYAQSKISGRFYLSGVSKSQIYAYCDLLMGYFLDVLKVRKPDFLLDVYPEVISRLILELACNRVGIKYLTMWHSRFQDYAIVSEGVTQPGTILRYSYNHDLNSALKAKEEISKFVNRSSLLNADEVEYSKTHLQGPSLLRTFKRLLISAHVTINFRYSRSRSQIAKGLKDKKFKVLVADASLLVILYNSLTILKVYWRCFKQVRDISLPSKFIYWPLSYNNEGEHLFTMGSRSDVSYIFSLEDVPKSVKILCKEHRSMLAERPYWQIKWFKQCKWISYIQSPSLLYNEPIELIKKADFVVTVNGTSGLESLLLRKPCLVLGNPIYAQFMRGKRRSRPGVSSLERMLRGENLPAEFSDDDLLLYLSAVISQGLSIKSYSSLLNMQDVTAESIEISSNISEFVLNKLRTVT